MVRVYDRDDVGRLAELQRRELSGRVRRRELVRRAHVATTSGEAQPARRELEHVRLVIVEHEGQRAHGGDGRQGADELRARPIRRAAVALHPHVAARPEAGDVAHLVGARVERRRDLSAGEAPL
jgi:hypothetical protein